MSDNERSRPAGNRTAPDDQLAGRIESNDTDTEAVSVAVEAAALATVLSCPDNRQARIVTAGLVAESFIVPEHRTVWYGILAALESGQPPHPVVVATAIQQAGIEVPPTWRGTLTSRLFEVAAEPAPVAMCRWLVEEVIQQANRRRVADAGRTIAGLAHRGQYAEMASGVREHVDALLTLLVEVNA